MQKNHSRYFIGLDLSSTDKLAIAHWRDKQIFAATDKPVPVENFHITLSFLGQVTQNKLEQLETLLDAISTQRVNTITNELGVFSKPKILYLGVELTPSLQQLAKQCLGVNGKLALPSPHEIYRPHITLNRKHAEAVPIMFEPPKLELNFTEFHLFESVSSSKQGKPPHYPKRMSFRLE
ncbi:hypothetical protein GCM10008107_23090 [Psychrosphaera saromensis]|uniref:RNA 2',3'-cyclic phosphodiesterase n=1 Tax=Psychrosphaera saromensis TaxID=716813 RepID=A0A2S7USV0_9GAMM|nr:RNA 2',3'-cyclic phosphodiesterase [Psychrosphaera saromensis]PQJ52350.1 2'-5' RNA ligase [Psychrosphaera saromensis]GHB73053.1 hypothetical protein GCM10008107_23090 [Psychrosphaera saromensis]GLQ13488.1 hypothetical protein GCM10007917_09430 [Psychrosphaera saromensis]